VATLVVLVITDHALDLLCIYVY